MPVCLTCAAWGRYPLCRECREQLVGIGPVSCGGLTVFSGYRHEGTARRLVHLLKYHGVVAAAGPLAAVMAEQLPRDTSALVPVPRAWLRRMHYGVDPAYELARRVGVLTGVPVAAVLQPRIWWPAHAGRDRASRVAPQLRLVAAVSPQAVLVDDVFTTGATLATAGRLVGVRRAATATRACGLSFDRIDVGRQQQRSRFAKSTG